MKDFIVGAVLVIVVIISAIILQGKPFTISIQGKFPETKNTCDK